MRAWRTIATRIAPSRSDLLAGLAGMVIGSLAGFGLMLWGNRINPVFVYNAHQRDGVVIRGGHLDIVFNIDRVRSCPSQTSRWLWTWVELDGIRVRQYFPLSNSNGDVTNLGDNQHVILSLQFPSYIWPGDWFFVSKTIEHCSLFPAMADAKILETAAIPIHIVDGQ